MFNEMMELVGDEFLDENEGPSSGCCESDATVITVPLAMHWWYEKYEELSNYMNFEFSISIYKSVDPAKAPKIEMVAVEVKAAPCDNCVVTMKASAVAFYVVDGSDWNAIKTDVQYDTNSPMYIKF